jgi:hypothetical protein
VTETPADDGQVETPVDDLSAVIEQARLGLRSQVAPLAEALEEGRLLVPLAKPMPNVEVGVETEVEGELSIAPHLIVDSDDLSYVVAFSTPDRLQSVSDTMSWKTGDGALEFCALPGRMVFEIALELVDGESVVGLVLDPMADSELMLQRHEIASLAQGKPIPLVGYVAQIPETPEDKTLVAELDEPPPKELTDIIDRHIAADGRDVAYMLKRTFNAERDLEPHWTLTLGGSAEGEGDLIALADGIAESLEGRIPAPGYIDILFDEELAS